MSDLEKKIEAIDDMTREIAAIQHNNYFILEQYRLVEEQIQKVRSKYEKKFRGDLASDDLLNKKIKQYREELELRNEVLPQSKRKLVLRITGQLKVQFLKAMLQDFAANDVETVTLDDMVNWCSRKSRSKGAAKILNELGIGDIAIPSTQFFQTTINGNHIRLYPTEAYVTKKPPEPAHFIVKKWKTWFDKEEERILAGKQNKEDKASARTRNSKVHSK
jgi:hypothetical protein